MNIHIFYYNIADWIIEPENANKGWNRYWPVFLTGTPPSKSCFPLTPPPLFFWGGGVIYNEIVLVIRNATSVPLLV